MCGRSLRLHKIALHRTEIGTEEINSLNWMIRNSGKFAVCTENMSSCLPSEFEPVRLYVLRDLGPGCQEQDLTLTYVCQTVIRMKYTYENHL